MDVFSPDPDESGGGTYRDSTVAKGHRPLRNRGPAV
jgi:hypothetical protein